MKVMRRIVVLSLLAALAVPFGFTSDNEGSSAEKKPYKIGDSVEPFTLKCHLGKERDLDKILGEKIVVLDFWNFQCPVSKGFEDQLKAITEKYKDKDIAFYAVYSNTINSVDAIKKYAEEAKLNYPVLKDEQNKIADCFGAAVTPEVFVIGKDKKIHYHGAISDNKDAQEAKNHFLTDALDALLAGKEVEVKESKAFGCTIKRVEK